MHMRMFRLIRMCAMTHGLMDWCPQDVPDDVTVYTHTHIHYIRTCMYVNVFTLHMYVRHDSWTRGLVPPRPAWRCHCIHTHTAFVYVYIYVVMYTYICWLWCHDSFICVPWLIRFCAMTHSYVWHDSFVRVPWHQAKAKRVLQDLAGRKFYAAPRLIYTRAMTYSYVCHDSFVRVPWMTTCESEVRAARPCGPQILCSATPHLQTCQVLFTRVPRLIYTRAMTYSYVCHDSFVCVPWLTTGESEVRAARHGGTQILRSAMQHDTPLEGPEIGWCPVWTSGVYVFVHICVYLCKSAPCHPAWLFLWSTSNWLMPRVDLRCVSLHIFVCEIGWCPVRTSDVYVYIHIRVCYSMCVNCKFSKFQVLQRKWHATYIIGRRTYIYIDICILYMYRFYLFILVLQRKCHAT